MKKYVLLFLFCCNMPAQDNNQQFLHREDVQQFLKAVKDDKVLSVISYLEDLKNTDPSEIDFAMETLWKHREVILNKKNNKEISKVLCRIILELMNQKKIEVNLSLLLDILTLLDKDILFLSEKELTELINNSISDKTNLASSIYEHFILHKEAEFPEIAALIVKSNNIDSNIVGKVLLKYNSEYFWKKVVDNLQKNKEKINVSIILGLEYCFETDYIYGLELTIALLQNDKDNTINQENMEYFLDFLDCGIRKYMKNHTSKSLATKNIFVDIFKLVGKNSKDISDFLLNICFEFQQEISFDQNIYEISLYIFPLVLKELETNPRNRPAELLLLLDPVILIQNKSELKNIFTKHIVELNDCLGKLILKEEGFIDFLPIFLNNPDKSISGILFDIYEKYQEQTFPYFEQGLKGSDECKKRIISVMLRTKNNLSEKFLTKHFIEVFNNLYVFPFPDNPTHNFRRLMVIVDISDIIEIIILEKVDIFHYNGIMVYQKVIDAIKKILKDKNFQIIDHPYLQNLQHGRLGIPIEIIQDNDPILRKNLLSVILEYKMDREDAIIAVLYYLLEAAVEKDARKEILTFPQEKIRTAFAKLKRYLVDKDASGQEVEKIEQKLMEIFGASFFPEGNKE